MQLAENLRQSIVLPKSKIGKLLLEKGQMREAIADECFIINIDDFESLWMSGLFQEINKYCGTRIGEYEDEVIPYEMLASLALQIDLVKLAIKGPSIDRFRNQLRNLCVEGIERRMPLYFIL